MKDKSKIDYSVYLVTNNELIPEGLTIYNQVEKALQNGATIVQLREKELDTGDFIKRAQKIHELTKTYNVPLIINDRVDVALSIDAEGVHVGQDDMDPVLVRKMIGNEKILGVSTRCEEELLGVINSEALIDYIGMGTTYSTSTKVVKRAPLGAQGVQALLKIISEQKPELKSVIIGGLNKYNIPFTLANCSYYGFNTNGVAVVSCIMGQQDAAKETKDIANSVKLGFRSSLSEINEVTSEEIQQITVSSNKPVIHFITNSVVKQFSANVCIAVGGSPIMSELTEEFCQFAKIPNIALVLNTGTPSTLSLNVYKSAIKAYNSQMKPIIYDPVACGATGSRRLIMEELTSVGYFTVIKGNMAELCTMAGVDGSEMRGVDSIMDLDIEKLTSILSVLAKNKRCVIVMTGKIDIVVDGITPTKSPRVAHISGGDPLMAEISGSGCALGGVIASYVASTSYFQAFEATVSAVRAYKKAGLKAASKSKGPGSFTIKFLDELYCNKEVK
ncbi:hypothetical protein C6P40_004607 [Pichia californica]|uniref:Thiamine phosphate synthase/TenI domain-containing protein n=1 Tax=Pichia californica TaxID=460514 RepID=A0A9P6WQ13_9ASCO|nr:hypothetical protein C6P40_004607 [[Candida] californica]